VNTILLTTNLQLGLPACAFLATVFLTTIL
jgi:hypothetical protein